MHMILTISKSNSHMTGTWCRECRKETAKNKIIMENEFNTNNLKKGEMIHFGRYLQKRDPSAAPDPIEWIIPETDGKSAKLLNRYGLTAKAFDDTGGWGVTRENCTLHTWLNSDFLNASFTNEEKQRLVCVKVEAVYDQFADTNDTREKVFVLNAEEAEKYFITDAERICIPTEKAISEGACHGQNRGPGCRWWLRTPGISMPAFVYVVKTDGSFDEDGFPVTSFGENDNDNIAVRPAIVLNLE